MIRIARVSADGMILNSETGKERRRKSGAFIVLAVSEDSYASRALLQKDEQHKKEEHKKEVAKVEEILTENLPRWWGPVSYGAQGCRTSVLDRKMQQIQQVWDRMSKAGRRPVFNRGFALGTKPVPRY